MSMSDQWAAACCASISRVQLWNWFIPSLLRGWPQGWVWACLATHSRMHKQKINQRCLNFKSNSYLRVFFMLCTKAYLIDFGVLFLAWLSNSNTYITLISLEYTPVKWQWSCSLRWRRHICTPRHSTHGWESQEQTALRADGADTGAAFHCLLQNVWIRAKRTQKWLRGEANALLRGGHTVTDPILKSDHSRQNAIIRGQ